MENFIFCAVVPSTQEKNSRANHFEMQIFLDKVLADITKKSQRTIHGAVSFLKLLLVMENLFKNFPNL